MRKTALVLALACAGCSGLIGFDVDTSGQSTIPGSPAGGVLGGLPAFGGFSDLSFTQSTAFQNNNTSKDHITACHLTKLSLKVVSPTTANLSFLSTVDFFIEAPGLSKVHIAGISAIPQGAVTVDLTVDARDISDYAKADSFSISSTATGQQPSQNTTI